MTSDRNVVLNDNVVLRWNEQLLETIRATRPNTGPTVTARALGVLHTATVRRLGGLRPGGQGHPPRRLAAAADPGAHTGQQEQGDQLRGLHDAGSDLFPTVYNRQAGY